MMRTESETVGRRPWPVAVVAVVALATLIGLWACGESTPVESVTVELTVTVTPDEIPLGQPIRARATVRNVSAGAAVITGIRQTLINIEEDRAILDDELEGELTVPSGETVTLLDGALNFDQNPPVGTYELIVVITGPGLEAEARDSFVLRAL